MPVRQLFESQVSAVVKGRVMSWEPVSPLVLSDTQFFRWQQLLEARTGMYLSAERKPLLQSILNIRMREIECADYDQYLGLVSAKPSGVIEWNILLDRLMIQETRFYRNPDSLDLFTDFVTERIKARPSDAPLNVWSVGCSTGEEPYTLAVLCLEIYKKLNRTPVFGVTGTDISLPALKKAHEGSYNARKLLDMQQELVLQYFEREGSTHFRVSDEVKRKVCFSMANIIDTARSPQRNMDVIYCQNVLIYFRKEKVHHILNSLTERLAPGGLLVIGQGEVTDWRHASVYRVSSNQALAFKRRDDI